MLCLIKVQRADSSLGVKMWTKPVIGLINMFLSFKQFFYICVFMVLWYMKYMYHKTFSKLTV